MDSDHPMCGLCPRMTCHLCRSRRHPEWMLKTLWWLGWWWWRWLSYAAKQKKKVHVKCNHRYHAKELFSSSVNFIHSSFCDISWNGYLYFTFCFQGMSNLLFLEYSSMNYICIRRKSLTITKKKKEAADI